MTTYAVPSRGRAAHIEARTLTALRAAGVDPASIELWVDDDEAADYEAAVTPGSYGALRVVERHKAMTLRDKRNHLIRTYPPGTRLIQCDDDLDAFVQARTKERPMLPVTDLPAVADWAFDTADYLGLGLWGPYPIANPFFMRQNATSDLRLITGGMFGITVGGDDTELLTVDEKEDFERCVRFAIRDGGVLRLNWLTFITSYYGGQPGGYSDYRTKGSVEEQAKRVAASYPDHVQYLGEHGARGYAEVRLRRGKSVAPPLPALIHD